MFTASTPATAPAATNAPDVSRYLAPVTTCPVELTNDEARKACKVFLVPADVAGTDFDVFVVAEPVAVWKWAPVGALALYAAHYQDAEGANELSSYLGRVQAVAFDEEEESYTFSDESGSFTDYTWNKQEVREMWTVVRHVAA
ncbi:hypothetical protein [Hymenobacter sediminicola]|uniref:Uncharacterized protein n=1 Tax=Hymenobacter sediminicola TaxID=2761579 RepID=A0A7G7W773_9BACT|nr:hypothetical protein [Hymenobacter sediminicola]QNH62216.1 hypothetical protein H4317_19105 [Hymenobacter sediminicola]